RCPFEGMHYRRIPLGGGGFLSQRAGARIVLDQPRRDICTIALTTHHGQEMTAWQTPKAPQSHRLQRTRPNSAPKDAPCQKKAVTPASLHVPHPEAVFEQGYALSLCCRSMASHDRAGHGRLPTPLQLLRLKYIHRLDS